MITIPIVDRDPSTLQIAFLHLASQLARWENIDLGSCSDYVTASEYHDMENAGWINVDTRRARFRLDYMGRGVRTHLMSQLGVERANALLQEFEDARAATSKRVAEAFRDPGTLETLLAGDTGYDGAYAFFVDSPDSPVRRMKGIGDRYGQACIMVKSGVGAGPYGHWVSVYGRAYVECLTLAAANGISLPARHYEEKVTVEKDSIFSRDATMKPWLTSDTTLVGERRGTIYRVRDHIGDGGTAGAYLVEGEAGEHYVAKILSGKRFPITTALRRRFEREGRHLEAVAHPNLLAFIDRAWAEGELVIVTEFIPGGTLYDLLARRFEETGSAALSVEDVARILTGVLMGLHAMHKVGLVHRDLAPKNIYLRDDGTPVLGDFGTVRAPTDSTLTATDEGLGSLLYISSSQFEAAHQSTPADDLFAVGQIAWQLLAGRRPAGNPPPIERVRPDIGRHLAQWVGRVRSEDVGERISDVSDALEQLTSAVR